MTALGASSVQHFTAVLRGHAGSKSVSIFTFTLVGLIRPLHLLSDFNSKVSNVAINGSRFNRDVLCNFSACVLLSPVLL